MVIAEVSILGAEASESPPPVPVGVSFLLITQDNIIDPTVVYQWDGTGTPAALFTTAGKDYQQVFVNGTDVWVVDDSNTTWRAYTTTGTAAAEPITVSVADVNGACADSGSFFAMQYGASTSYTSGKVYTVNPSTGAAAALASTIPTTSRDLYGLAFDGADLYTIGRRFNVGRFDIIRVSASTGAVLSTVEAALATSEVFGLTWHSGNVVVFNFVDEKLYTINPTTGATVSSSSAGSFPTHYPFGSLAVIG